MTCDGRHSSRLRVGVVYAAVVFGVTSVLLVVHFVVERRIRSRSKERIPLKMNVV